MKDTRDNIRIFDFLMEGDVTVQSEPEYATAIQMAIDADGTWVRIGAKSMVNLGKVLHIERIDVRRTK